MDSSSVPFLLTVAVLLLLLLGPQRVSSGDIVHDDNVAPKRLGCTNKFVLVRSIPLEYLSPILK